MATMVQAQVAYYNLFRENPATVAYNAFPLAGFEPVNAYDWRDFSIWRVAESGGTPGDAWLQVGETTGHVGETASQILLWMDTATAGSCTLYITTSVDDFLNETVIYSGALSSSAGFVWMNLGATITITAPRKVRVRFTNVTGAINFRQIYLGELMQFPIGQWAGVNPPNLPQGYVMENVISVNGSVIGRNVRRTEKAAEIDINYLDPAWVRATWAPFAVACSTHAFFIRWDPVGHSGEVAFGSATDIPAPTNAVPPPRMAARLPYHFLSLP